MEAKDGMMIIATLVVTVLANIISNKITQLSVIDKMAKFTGKAIALAIKALIRFGLSVAILIWCAANVVWFGVSDQPLTRGDILLAIFNTIFVFAYVKMILKDIVDLQSGRRPL
ncbi:hypothetical protein JQR88_10955 [Pseudomonas luteola]|uniref:hypothetical protein n=1 Tax=Pseudomonas luteola TaxID=47886 RepID=UPI003DA131DE